jgi:DHA1 family bicyclomycin/chloramphenicol resistance-like MFS transporter
MLFILSPRQKRQILFAMTALMLLTASATDIYVPSLPEMVRDFHTSPSVINLTLSSYNLGIAFAVLFVGEISNRFGRRISILYAVAGFTVSSFLIAITPWISVIILLRIIQALGTAIVVIVPRLILKDSLDVREQIRGNGILLMGLMISPAIAPVLGAYLAHYLGWRSCFTFSGIFGVLLWWYCWKVIPETNTTPIDKFAGLHSYLSSYRLILTSRSFVVLTSVYAGAVGAYYAFLGVSSYLYIDHWHFSPTAYSYLFLGLSAAYFAGNILMQRLNRMRLHTVKIIGFGVYSTLIGAIIVVVAFLLSPKWLVILCVTLGVLFMRAANAIINPTTQVKLMSVFHEQSAHALGLNMCISFSTGALAIWLVTLHPGRPFLSLVLVSVISVAICVLMYASSAKRLQS